MTEISPRIDDDGVGVCDVRCPQAKPVLADLKVDCSVLAAEEVHGHCHVNTGNICIPWAIRLAAENKRLKEELAEAREHINW